jgi:hypothetical protein
VTQPAPLPYTNIWRWNNQAPPPINGQIRTDSRDFGAATHVFISNVTDAGLNVGPTLAAITVGSTLTIAHNTDPTRNAKYTTKAAPLVQANYVDVSVTLVSTAGTIPNSGTLCTLSVEVPASVFTITWKVASVAGRPNRYVVTCSCPHGTLSEYAAMRVSGMSSLPASTLETTAGNLVRRTSCTCRGLTPAAMADEVDLDEVLDVESAGL